MAENAKMFRAATPKRVVAKKSGRFATDSFEL